MTVDWLQAQPHPTKIVIAGNHELLLDANYSQKSMSMSIGMDSSEDGHQRHDIPGSGSGSGTNDIVRGLASGSRSPHETERSAVLVLDGVAAVVSDTGSHPIAASSVPDASNQDTLASSTGLNHDEPFPCTHRDDQSGY